MTVSGFVFLGAMEAFIFVPLMPILIENLALVTATDAKTSRLKKQALEEGLSDQAASIF